MTDAAGQQNRRSDWCALFRCFRIATDPVKMWLGFLGAAFTILMLVFACFLFLEVRQLSGGATSRRVLEHVRKGDSGAAWQELRQGLRMARVDVGRDLDDIGHSVFSGELMPALRRAPTLRKVVAWSLIMLLLLWLPWAYFGGAISRAAVFEYATGERLTGAEARRFAASRYSSYLWPPVVLVLLVAGLILCGTLVGLAAAHLPAAIVFLFGSLLSLYALVVVKQKTESGLSGGLVGLGGLAGTVVLAWLLWTVHAGWLGWAGRLVVVLVFPLLLALAIPALFVVLVLLFGRGLMISTVSYEGTDAFDAVSRGGDYVLKRPWHLALCTLISIVYGAPCLAVVTFFAVGGFVLASAAVWAGFGEAFGTTYDAVFNPARGVSLFEPFPGFLLRVVFVLLCGFVAGWGVSFVQSCRAVSYALIRKRVDLCETSEVFVDLDRLPAAPPAAPAGDEKAPHSQP